MASTLESTLVSTLAVAASAVEAAVPPRLTWETGNLTSSVVMAVAEVVTRRHLPTRATLNDLGCRVPVFSVGAMCCGRVSRAWLCVGRWRYLRTYQVRKGVTSYESLY